MPGSAAGLDEVITRFVPSSIFFIADEVITGFGRTASFHLLREDIVPIS